MRERYHAKNMTMKMLVFFCLYAERFAQSSMNMDPTLELFTGAISSLSPVPASSTTMS
jgi:hypothetical protein